MTEIFLSLLFMWILLMILRNAVERCENVKIRDNEDD